jgi:hypothetical protein
MVDEVGCQSRRAACPAVMPYRRRCGAVGFDRPGGHSLGDGCRANRSGRAAASAAVGGRGKRGACPTRKRAGAWDRPASKAVPEPMSNS